MLRFEKNHAISGTKILIYQNHLLKYHVDNLRLTDKSQ